MTEITAQIQRLGLDRCRVCSSTEVQVDRRPTILSVGGLAWEDPATRDREANIIFALQIKCELCGYIMLFDSAKFHGGDEPTMEIT